MTYGIQSFYCKNYRKEEVKMKSCVFESRLFAQTQMLLIFYSTYMRVPIWMYAHMSPTLGAHTHAHAHGIWVGMGAIL